MALRVTASSPGTGVVARSEAGRGPYTMDIFDGEGVDTGVQLLKAAIADGQDAVHPLRAARLARVAGTMAGSAGADRSPAVRGAAPSPVDGRHADP